MTETATFINFGNAATGRVVTGDKEVQVVYSRNPYGSHNVVLVEVESMEAIRHGTEGVLVYAFLNMSRKAYRRVRAFLAARGVAADWSFIP